MQGQLSSEEFAFIAEAVLLHELVREALRLVMVEGATEAEVAAALDVTPERAAELLEIAQEAVASHEWPGGQFAAAAELLELVANVRASRDHGPNLAQDGYQVIREVQMRGKVLAPEDLGPRGEAYWRNVSETERRRGQRKRKR